MTYEHKKAGTEIRIEILLMQTFPRTLQTEITRQGPLVIFNQQPIYVGLQNRAW